MALTHITPNVLDIPKMSVALINDTTTGGIKNYIDTPLTTPLLLDNSVAAATTEFVQRKGLTYPKLSSVDISTDIILTAAHTGRWLAVNAGVNITLPLISTTGITGATYTFIVRHNCTLLCTGADLILNAGGTSTSTRVLLAGETITLVANNAIGWAVVANGVGADSITNNLSTNGYQMLAGGMIIQWGTGLTGTTTPAATVTFPIAFPTACLSVTGSQHGTNPCIFILNTLTPTSFTCTVNLLDVIGYGYVGGVATISAQHFYWMAIGH